MSRQFLWFALILFLAGPVRAETKDDPSSWEPIPIAGRQKMPPFEGITDWINGKAVQPKDLKGKVVVVHFLTFG